MMNAELKWWINLIISIVDRTLTLFVAFANLIFIDKTNYLTP